MEKVNQAVFAAVRRVAQEKSLPYEHIAEHQTLVEELGFRSLDLARIVAMIELDLDANPFATLVPVTSIRTVGDLCTAYAKCFTDQGERAAQSDGTGAGRRAPGREHQRDLRRRVRSDGK